MPLLLLVGMMDLRRGKRKSIPPRHIVSISEKENRADTKTSWDDWVPQDRLRKFNEENKELASNLKKETVSYTHLTLPTKRIV